MEFDYNGRKIPIRDDPLTGDEIRVRKYYRKVMAPILGLNNLSEEERKMDFQDYINKLAKESPERFGEYATEVEVAEEFETIMLATGLDRGEILAFPKSVRLALFEKCKEALHGTARDFFGWSKKSMSSPQNQVYIKESPTSQQET